MLGGSSDQLSAWHLIMIVELRGFLFIGREVVCWNWKVNRSVKLMEEIIIELKKANEKSSAIK